MTGKKIQTTDDAQTNAGLVKEIQNNINSLRASIDQILNDMNDIRSTRHEILEKMDSVKNVNENSAQIQITIGKAKKIMGKAEENRQRLQLVLSKINDLNFAHSLISATEPDNDNKNTVNVVTGKSAKHWSNLNSGPGKPCLLLLTNNKYLLSCPDDSEQGDSKLQKGDVRKIGMKESALQEIQWIVKTKLYRIRHHYQRLADQTVELPMK